MNARLVDHTFTYTLPPRHRSVKIVTQQRGGTEHSNCIISHRTTQVKWNVYTRKRTYTHDNSDNGIYINLMIDHNISALVVSMSVSISVSTSAFSPSIPPSHQCQEIHVRILSCLEMHHVMTIVYDMGWLWATWISDMVYKRITSWETFQRSLYTQAYSFDSFYILNLAARHSLMVFH